MESIILYSFASRSRPDKFYKSLDNIRAMSNSVCYFVVAKIDSDDPNIDEYLKRLEQYPEVRLKLGKSENKVHAINRDLTEIPNWHILCSHSDDMKYFVKGFDDIIREQMDEDCFLHFPDGVINEKISTYSMMDKVYYERFGYIYFPHYKNVYCDNEAFDVAKLTGRHKFVNHQIFVHEHPIWGKAEWDEQYRKTEEPVGYARDGQLYHNRKANNFYL